MGIQTVEGTTKMPKRTVSNTTLESKKVVYTPTEFDKAMDVLMDAFGFKGESGTELLYYHIRDMVDELEGVIEASHEEGLCYDMTAAMAGTLQKYADARQPTLRTNN